MKIFIILSPISSAQERQSTFPNSEPSVTDLRLVCSHCILIIQRQEAFLLRLHRCGRKARGLESITRIPVITKKNPHPKPYPHKTTSFCALQGKSQHAFSSQENMSHFPFSSPSKSECPSPKHMPLETERIPLAAKQ